MNVRYRKGADEPGIFDCWSYFRWVQRQHFGREMPAIETPGALSEIVRTLLGLFETIGWRSVDAPETGDAVLMSHHRHPHHIGLYVGDLARPHVLHCHDGGVSLHDQTHLARLRWRTLGFYRYGL